MQVRIFLSVLNSSLIYPLICFLVAHEGIFVARDAHLSASYTQFVSNGGITSTGRTEGGGALATIDGVLIVDTCTFTLNSAKNGGAIYVDRKGRATLENSGFESNFADTSGGAILASMKGAVSITSQTSFTTNSAVNGGAVACKDNSSVSVEEANFTTNQAELSGGAIYISDDAVFKASSSEFSGNTGRDGGAVYVQGMTNASIDDCYFLSNSALLRGGAFYYDTIMNLSMTVITCETNHASSGGCIYWHSIVESSPVYPCNNCTMIDNSIYDVATNTRSVSVLWWPSNVSSGLATMEPADEESIETINASNQSVADTTLVWPRLKAVDLYGQVEVLDDTTYCSVASQVNGSLSGYIGFKPRDSVYAVNGVMSFDGAVFSAEPRSDEYVLKMSCSIQNIGPFSFIQGVKMVSCAAGYSTDNGYVVLDSSAI